MHEPVGFDDEGATTNRVCVVVGTSHRIQCRAWDTTPKESRLIGDLESRVRELVGKYTITLVAEEAPYCDHTVVRQIAVQQNVPYRQIDMLTSEYKEYGIQEEMDVLARFNSKGDSDYRCPHADGIRENSWLDRIEKDPSASRVLLVCGYAHTTFLTKKVRERGRAAEEVFFPEYLRERKIVELPIC